MKKLAGILLCAAVFLLSGCELFYLILGDPAVGQWECESYTINGTTYPSNPSTMSMTLTANADKTWIASGYSNGSPINATGTWSRSGNTCTIIQENPPLSFTATLSEGNRVLTCHDVDMGGTMGTIVFRKR